MPLTLDFSNAEAQRLKITQEQQKQIENLYKQASKHIGELAEQAPRVPSDVVRQQYLRDLQQQVNDTLRGVQRDLGSTIQEHSKQVAAETVKDAKEFLREIGLPIGGAYSNVPKDVVQAVASGQLYSGNWTLSRALWLNTVETQKDVQSVVAQGILENKSAYDIAKDLEKYVDPSARKDWEWSKVYPGTRKVVDYNAQRLARTMVSHAYQQAFVRTTIKNPFITKYQWQAAATERTCEICMERDGQLFDKDALPLDHPNGMCTYLAVIEESMEDVADRLVDWAAGKSDPELDAWAEDLYGKGWEPVKTESRVPIAKAAVDNLGSLSWERGVPIKGAPSDADKAFTPLNFDLSILNMLRYGGNFDRENPETVEVYLSQLKTPQAFVYKDKVKSYIDKITSGESLLSSDKGGIVSGIQVFEYNGELYLYEGNHRTSAYKLLGFDKITVEKIKFLGSR